MLNIIRFFIILCCLKMFNTINLERSDKKVKIFKIQREEELNDGRLRSGSIMGG